MSWHVVDTRSRAPVATFEPSPDPELSVVVVTFGTGAIVVDCLAALAGSLRSIRHEVIVVDNRCDGGLPTADRLRLTTSGVRLIVSDRNLGFGGGNELGMAHARGPLICLMNPDVVVLAAWASPLLEAASGAGIGIAAPVLLDPDRSVQEAGQTVDAEGVTRPIRSAPDAAVADVAYASAACWMMRREVVERAGGFDAAYHPAYFEDVDLALRVGRTGLRNVVVSASRVIHHHGGSTRRRPAPALAQQAVFRRRWAPALRGANRTISRV